VSISSFFNVHLTISSLITTRIKYYSDLLAPLSSVIGKEFRVDDEWTGDGVDISPLIDQFGVPGRFCNGLRCLMFAGLVLCHDVVWFGMVWCVVLCYVV